MSNERNAFRADYERLYDTCPRGYIVETGEYTNDHAAHAWLWFQKGTEWQRSLAQEELAVLKEQAEVDKSVIEQYQLKAKAAVPEGLLDRIDSAITAFTSGRASMHVPPEANDVDMVLAECWKMVKSMLAAAPSAGSHGS